MKNTTLLKVLSASAIFTAIAAIESYDHNAFATEVTATANNTQSDVETKTVPQDVKNLPDGTYELKKVGDVKALNFSQEDKESMAAAGLDTEKTKLVVKNGQYSVNVSFKPIEKIGFKGYLGDLKYYDGDKTHANRSEIKDSEFKDTTIVENYSENEKDASIDTFKKKFPGRTVYPKTLSYNVDKNKIDANNKLETFTQVFVPVMESIFPGAGTQRMILNYDLSSLATKTITVPKVDTEKLAKEKAEKERIEAERLAKEKAEKERIERERLAKEKTEKERIEAERLAKEKAEKERIERERLAKEKAEKERIEAERLAKEKAEKERIERERLAKEKAEKERIEAERLAKEKAEKERIEAERLAKEKAEKERLEKEKPIVTAKGEAAILKVTEFDLEGYIKNHQGPITAKGEAAILDKPEFDLEEYIRSQKGSVGEVPSNAKVPYNSKEEFTNKNKENADFKDSTDVKDSQDKKETTSTPKPLINDIFGQSEVKDTFVATPVSNKENTKNTLDIKKSLANTGTTAATTGFFGLITLLTAFVLRRKVNK
ncbi:hypothetical protein PNO30_08160 [Gemella haemolysans]|uniref:LPXTG-motif protein cell wall anchor domain protein n=1 Tax=Gemella haemolysans TaxID=1379 RepID=A0AAW6B478_9BACL|nr:hypothetical protein [Gemella haemolysans]MDB6186733.1 hypothetical protein [Gemella haemolysans]